MLYFVRRLVMLDGRFLCNFYIISSVRHYFVNLYYSSTKNNSFWEFPFVRNKAGNFVADMFQATLSVCSLLCPSLAVVAKVPQKVPEKWHMLIPISVSPLCLLSSRSIWPVYPNITKRMLQNNLEGVCGSVCN
jgi:hypothetical protein